MSLIKINAIVDSSEEVSQYFKSYEKSIEYYKNIDVFKESFNKTTWIWVWMIILIIISLIIYPSIWISSVIAICFFIKFVNQFKNERLILQELIKNYKSMEKNIEPLKSKINEQVVAIIKKMQIFQNYDDTVKYIDDLLNKDFKFIRDKKWDIMGSMFGLSPDKKANPYSYAYMPEPAIENTSRITNLVLSGILYKIREQIYPYTEIYKIDLIEDEKRKQREEEEQKTADKRNKEQEARENYNKRRCNSPVPLIFLKDFEPKYGDKWTYKRMNILRKFNFTCTNCEKNYKNEYLHIHHIIPLSLGGSNRLSNLTIKCILCHSKEHGHLKIDCWNLDCDGEMIHVDDGTTEYLSCLKCGKTDNLYYDRHDLEKYTPDEDTDNTDYLPF